MKIPFWDLRIQNSSLKAELLAAVDQVLTHGRFVLGPEVLEFEQRIAEFCGVKFAVGVNSGTDAVYLALRSIGVGEGDEVIVPALSWIATANAVSLTGAVPVFSDIGMDLNLDPDSIEKCITSKTKAIMPVHFMGQICEMNAIDAIARKHGLLLVEDSAQAFGARRDGKVAGSFGKVSAFSMNPMKVFAACGEAGAVVTDDERAHEALLALRYNGMVDKVECRYKSLNGRIDTMQAALLLVKLKYLQANIEKRRSIAKFYRNELKGPISFIPEPPGATSAYFGFTLFSSVRDSLGKYLASKGIETKLQHYPLMPDQPIYKDLSSNRYPNAKRLAEQILNIPLHENLTEEEARYVVDSVNSFFDGSGT